MISMLEDQDVLRVQFMNQYEIDYLHDKEANRLELWLCIGGSRSVLSGFTLRIGTLMPKKKEKKQPLDLDQGGRDDFKGHDIQYYLDTMRLEPKR
jgi:uncharacterized protein YneR